MRGGQLQHVTWKQVGGGKDLTPILLMTGINLHL